MASRIYTRTGDRGDTGLFGGTRVGKDDGRVEAYGTVDELNAVLGVARAANAQESGPTRELDALLAEFQHDLFSLGADLATPPDDSGTHGRATMKRIGPERVTRLESLIDTHEAELPPLTHFILPGGGSLAAHLHLSRTVCRRAERRCVALSRAESVSASTFDAGNEAVFTAGTGIPAGGGQAETAGGEAVNPEVVRYLNRLSDLLFVLARVANHRAGIADVLWNP